MQIMSQLEVEPIETNVFQKGQALNSQHVPYLEEVPFIAIKAQLIGSKNATGLKA